MSSIAPAPSVVATTGPSTAQQWAPPLPPREELFDPTTSRQWRRTRIRFEALTDAHIGRLRSSAPDPADAVTIAVFEPDLQAALDALQPNVMEAVVLRDVRGLTYQQIAAELGVKEATVRTRVHR